MEKRITSDKNRANAEQERKASPVPVKKKTVPGKNISQAKKTVKTISGDTDDSKTKPPAKEEIKKDMPGRDGIPLQKTAIKKAPQKILTPETKPSIKEEIKKDMPGRDGIPLQKTAIKKSPQNSQKVLTPETRPPAKEEIKKDMPGRDGIPLQKTAMKKTSQKVITPETRPPAKEEIKKDMPGREDTPLKKSVSPSEEIIIETKDLPEKEPEKVESQKDISAPRKTMKKVMRKVFRSPTGEIIRKEIIDNKEIKKEIKTSSEKFKKELSEKEEEVIKPDFPSEDTSKVIETEIKRKKIEEKIVPSEKATVPLSIKDKEEKITDEKEFIDECLKKVLDLGASDLHLSTGQKPVVRCRGELNELDLPVFREEIKGGLIKKILSEGEVELLLKQQSVNFMYTMPSEEGPPHRFRSNAYYHRSGLNIVMRIIPNKIPTIQELGMPEILSAFGRFNQGLVLVTGSSGSGKTTTLTALIDLINTERNDHIITIEDPIEFIHKPKRCIVRQRQIGVHTRNYNRALKASIREDPDVILVSELRDLETIQLAMTAAETGCLVLSTMSTTSAARTIDRIIDFFPSDQRLQAGAMLSDSLRAVISQQLVPSVDRSVRFASVEVLIGCTPLSSLIREQKTFQISSLIETSRGLGMQSMDSSLLNLLENQLIRPEIAYEAALDKSLFEQFINPSVKNQG